jgi:xylitol oxidase
VALGALGIVTGLTLAIKPTYDIRQFVYERLPIAAFIEQHAEILASGYSVSAFTDWQRSFDQIWFKRLATMDAPPSDWFGSTLADGARNPVPGAAPEHSTQQSGTAGPWNERLPHFRMEFTPSSGEELQSEYFVAREHSVEALAAVHSLAEDLRPILQIGEVRTVTADQLWLSPANGRDSLALHFTWIKDHRAVTPVVSRIEELLAPLAARPHWAKVFTNPPEVFDELYPDLEAFRQLRQDFDPAGKFTNHWLNNTLTLAR